ncbi:uncharacterized protein LOC115717516 [Cannabis sativa]|uniref:uncharacterized protein LOC115717516 n=1 Tax=Cannabis sativa TaxID=3483 RepID=UPI0029CA3276|nr:uncharacterized protein LOC115717516 [Cannabis sativa]
MDIRSRICGLMQIQEAGVDSMYLGLPSIVGCNKNAVLGFLKERMRKKINGWEGKVLSRDGKEVLIKSVVQSLPSYAMNIFLFPIGPCKEIERMMASFWWKSTNSNGNGSGIVWMNWDKMTKHKAEGDMGLRNNYLSADLGSNPRFIWSSIFAAKDTVKLSLRKRIGSGLTVQITLDPWLPVMDRPSPFLLVPGLKNFSVSNLFQVGNQSWDADIVCDLFSPTDDAIILGIPIQPSGGDDSWYWLAEKNGFYSVRSAYKLLQDQKHHSDNPEGHTFWKKLWSLKVPPKMKDLVWRAASNCLATKIEDLLEKPAVEEKELDEASEAVVEVTVQESVATENPTTKESEYPLNSIIDPIQREPSSRDFQRKMAKTKNAQSSKKPSRGSASASTEMAVGREPLSLLIWLEESASRVDNETLCKIVMLCWALWSTRNDLIWQQHVQIVRDVVVFANSRLDQYLKAQGRGNIPLLSPLKEGDGSERWIKPDTCIKLNIDATTFDRDFKHGYGCVVRNTNGELVSVFSGFKHGNVSPELAEIMGIREALSWLNCHNYTRAAIETDNLVCVEAIWSAESFASGFDLVVEKCKNILKNLLNVSLFFVKRSANRAVHFIARHSISLAEL